MFTASTITASAPHTIPGVMMPLATGALASLVRSRLAALPDKTIIDAALEASGGYDPYGFDCDQIGCIGPDDGEKDHLADHLRDSIAIRVVELGFADRHLGLGREYYVARLTGNGSASAEMYDTVNIHRALKTFDAPITAAEVSALGV